MKKTNLFEMPLFALGFRPFFVFAGFSAFVLIMLWKSIYSGSSALANYYPGFIWHAHEMLLGYTAAVIAGFLLTAVKNWTGIPTWTGGKLAALCLLWLYGRILPFYAGMLPNVLIAAVDFAFIPVLTYGIAKPIMQSQHYKSLVFIGLLMLMMLGNAMVHLEMLGWTEHSAELGIQLVLMIIVLMILIMAGRIFPFFTERGLPGALAMRDPVLDNIAVGTAALVFVLAFFKAPGLYMALAAAAAVLSNILRVANWYVLRVWFVPLLWILYAGYGWIIIGLLLTALSAYELVLPALALHAFSMGGIGVLTLGMMSRVSLGHTGRALRASKVIAISFILINLAVFFRVFLPVFFPDGYAVSLLIATSFWLLAFSLFSFVYTPMLASPRADGKPG